MGEKVVLGKSGRRYDPSRRYETDRIYETDWRYDYEKGI